MPLLAIHPTADSGVPDWQPIGAASNWQAVSDGNDGTFNRSGLPADRDLFVLGDLPGGASTVLDVTLVYRAQHSGDSGVGTFYPVWAVGVNETIGPSVTIGPTATTYKLYGVACPDGAAWSVAKVNALVCGYEARLAPAGKYLRILDVTLHVTYDETSLLMDVPGADVSLTRTAASDLACTRTAAADVFLER